MFTSRFVRTLFCTATLLAATIVPASSKTTAASKPRANRAPRTAQQQKLPLNTKMRCYDTGAMSRCCTDSNFCCTWHGPDEPVCRYGV